MSGNPGKPPLHLVHVFPTFAVGGSQIRFGQLAAAHGARYRHTVLALDGVIDMKPRLAEGVSVETLVPDLGKASGLGSLLQRRRYLALLKPDRLVTYNWGAMDWCLANRLRPLAPHIHLEDGFGPEEKSRQFARRIWLRRFALSGGHTRVAVPSRNLAHIAADIWRLPARAIHFIPNGIDFARFAAASTRPSATAVTVGTIATLRREKNLARLIRAFADAADARPPGALRLVIVGDGPERAALEQIARDTGRGDIVFAGATRTPEAHLAGFDIFALSSDTEQMPLSVLEAMAARLPVLSFAVGDVPDMVAEQNRVFVSAALADEASFRDHLDQLIGSADLRARLGEANQARAKAQYDERLMAERYAALFG
jgi:glycosyltransferase involved in cell wall biosynthesis